MLPRKRKEKHRVRFSIVYFKGGKVRYFEGTPIPSTVLIAMLIQYLLYVGSIGLEGQIIGGKWIILGWSLHPFSLLYALSGTLMVSESLIIPKP
jgi:CDP-diacylglycerol--serine O-phosphatidyltransferase